MKQVYIRSTCGRTSQLETEKVNFRGEPQVERHSRNKVLHLRLDDELPNRSTWVDKSKCGFTRPITFYNTGINKLSYSWQ